jgi:deoxycytidylate deaminase
MTELHICKYCGVETTQPDEECYAKPKQNKIMKKKIVYSEKYNKGTFIEKQEILKFLQSSVVLSPEIIEATRYNDDSESYIFKINIPKEYLDNK